jgi:hypothetical protein
MTWKTWTAAGIVAAAAGLGVGMAYAEVNPAPRIGNVSGVSPTDEPTASPTETPSASPTETPSASPTDGRGGPTTAPSTPPSATSAAPPASTGRTARKTSEGGTVTARCTTGGTLTLVNATPRQGFAADLDDAPAEVKFTSDDHRTEIGISCAGGVPRFAVEEDDDRGDNSGPGGGGSDDGSNSGPGG